MANVVDEAVPISIEIIELEDFTTYEVLDPWGGVINVSTNQIDIINEPAVGSAYVRKIFPTDTFTDFTHTFKAILTSLDPTHNIGIWAVTNGANDYYEMYRDLDGLSIVFFRIPSGAVYRVSMYDWSTFGGELQYLYWDGCQVDIQYTFVVQRAGALLTCEIYDGETLLHTLSIPCNTIPYKQLVPHYSYRVGAVDLYGSATITDYNLG